MPGRHFVVLCQSILIQPATADVYTWTDDRGVTHFSDTAPAAHKPEQVTLGTPSVIPMADGVRQSETVSAIRRKVQKSLERDAPDQPRTRSESSAEEKECEKLQLRIRKIQQRLRAGYSNDHGNSLRRQRRELGQQYSRECVLG